MPDSTHDHDPEQPLSERFLDLFVFLPTGLAVTLAEELPRMAERGRERLGVQVNSARAVGRFAVTAGGHELKRRSEGLRRTPPAAAPEPAGTGRPERTAAPVPTTPRLRSIPRPPVEAPEAPLRASTPAAPTTAAPPVATEAPPEAPAPRPAPAAPAGSGVPAPTPVRTGGGHVPEVASLAIPGFDTLSASQVVQRLDGLSRSELVAVRAYETSTRGRRTILSRVDQLLDERS